MSTIFERLSFTRGPSMKNRFVLAPMTNTQSGDDGVLADEEYKWLTMRAEGGFGLTMTCAAHVQEIGKGFPGQLGVFSDAHIPGLTRLAAGIKAHDSIAIVQLHHAGTRSPAELIGETPVCPSDDEETKARAMTTREVEDLVEDFIAAAVRCEQAGFHGVEVHGAHGYIITQFLSAEINQRTDQYGGNLENRSRILFEILAGIRRQCGPDFCVGVRLSPERFGMRLGEVVEVAQRLMSGGEIDFLDMSLWDINKEPEEEAFKGRTLMSCFTDLDRGGVRLGVTGNIRTPQEAERALEAGADWVMLGRAAMLHHDFPNQYQANPSFAPVEIPVTREHLHGEGLSDKFLTYISWLDGFVVAEEVENA
ncbi:MAG: NADH:flavin oxidoreductase [Gemmatimonadetes bacterium]|jgi:2,4-dienoyl-CoA reductase-like NADH-dependent reductase (Old Yellow Enzyme family)|nr:NADH:flavin oxidoreductase [Gemmatimonadota bacterium]MBT6149838.1 NADH:flavin oxidoreductase [Gemmatimonadota bacterium]MBT7860884.1 NADH:flavin oxidoreductase [Gemmatimonadota bacterium]